MNFAETTLTFRKDRIIAEDGKYVMMSWEAPIMKKIAKYICSDGGDILELGFGMGISADYIQSHNIDSHTIVECHPQVLERLHKWAEDKPNVKILEGQWWDVRRYFQRYDGIFHDTYRDKHTGKLGHILPLIGKDNMKFTYFASASRTVPMYELDKEFSIEFEKINIHPPKNDYYTDDVYYLPKVEYGSFI